MILRHSRSPFRTTGVHGTRHAFTPFLDVSKPIRWTIRVQPAIGRNTADDHRGVPEPAEEQIVVLGVEGVDVGVVDESWISAGGWPDSGMVAMSAPRFVSVWFQVILSAKRTTVPALFGMQPNDWARQSATASVNPAAGWRWRRRVGVASTHKCDHEFRSGGAVRDVV
jgi:hypothetical protein